MPPFEAGSHIDVITPAGHTRQYSLCNDEQERHRYVIAVKREPQSRGGSASMHDTLTAGTTLTIGYPRNNFELDAHEPAVILLAAGIGITPLLAMAFRLGTQGRTFALHYFVRGDEHIAFRDILLSPRFSRWVELHRGLDAAATRATLAKILAAPPAGAGVYLCGPLPFIEAGQQCMAGKSGCNLHVEYFAAPPQAPHDGDQPFEVILARTGRTLVVPPGKSIVDTLADAGIHADVSCEQGVCGTCITPVLGGVPDHRDVYLTDEEKASGKCMMICVSRARGARLELDL
ncbi:PDR/VanB family oxidoreductase [Paraburkholderia xenovorans]|uniref:PDR/VanB family oxidoreductase n=1 Tax=Paraburkholderia xenovorans TaxID=36873 RepID=UPI001F27E21B|nr:PDR/VanB family oxidoreductase [Paraburkholderia xenovorans]